MTSFWKDAVLLRQIIVGTLAGRYLPLASLITDYDKLTCDLIYKTMCSNRTRRDEFVRAAEALLEQPFNLTSSEEAFQRFLARFREGPSQNEQEEAATGGTGPAYWEHHATVNLEDRPRARGQRPPSNQNNCAGTEDLRELTPTEVRRVRENLCRQETEDPLLTGGTQRQESSRLEERPTQRRPAYPQPRRNEASGSEDEIDIPLREGRTRRLQPQEIMEFDPRKNKVALFIKRIN